MTEQVTSSGTITPELSPVQKRWMDRLATLYRRLSHWLFRLVTTLIVDVFLLFESTVDVRIYGMERLKAIKRAGRSPLLVLWHGQGLLPIANFRHERLCLYASHTRDPNYAKSLLILRWWTLRFVERLGFQVLDASQFKSESRGVLQFVEILRGGTGSVIAADGPQGPIYKAKPGPTFLAKKSGVLLLPIGGAIGSGFHLDQWDQFEIPLPFTQAVLVAGEPIEVPSHAKEADLEGYRLKLETAMNALVEEAQERLERLRAKPAQQIEADQQQREQQRADKQRIEQK